MNPDGRDVILYLNDHLDEAGDPIALRCAEVWIHNNKFLLVRWIPEDEEVELIPVRRLLSVIGVFEGYELEEED